ncbi:MAG: hypothetical protein KDC66_07130 [Phaeodactylibacter sp.]|nr:hypothetical protein [Phaeodactylibacter sp.]MCB9275361.1 hypothetical protein [Lewinellaceae bacterium]
MPKPPVRVVAFTPPTGRPFGTDCILNTEIKFLSDAYNDNDDIIQRWGLALKKINIAGTYLARNFPSDPSSTLKLFVGPEWLFRKKNIKQTDAQIESKKNTPLKYAPPYAQDDVIKLLKQIIKDSQLTPYNSWLIIPGTIYWGKKGAKGKKWDTYNVAPVVYNGQLLSLVHKQKEADKWDAHEDWGNGQGNDNILLAKALESSANIVKQLSLDIKQVDTRGLFECENIRFALEICGDHLSSGGGRLFKELKNELSPQLKTRLNVGFDDSGFLTNLNDTNDAIPIFNETLRDIQLLVSCGSKPAPSGNVTRIGGYFINADGSVSERTAARSSIPDRMYGSLQGITNLISRRGMGNKYFPTIAASDELSQRTLIPANSTDVYQRLTIYNALLDLNSGPVSSSVTETVSTTP